METLDIKTIRSFQPCYDPTKHLPEDWSGSVEEFLCYEHIPPQDRLWVVLRTETLSNNVLREFALQCARSVEEFASDSRIKACNDITEAYSNGLATLDQLKDATTYATTYAAYAANVVFGFPSEIQCDLLLHVINMEK